LLFGNRLENQATGQLVTAELSFRKSVDLLAALFRHRFPGRDDTALKELYGQLCQAEQKRNIIVHWP
jgi:hypothetical protein